MTTEKFCPKCETEMTDGFAVSQGYGGPTPTIWVAGKPETSWMTGLKTTFRERYNIRAYRCPKCNYVEFYTAEKSNI